MPPDASDRWKQIKETASEVAQLKSILLSTEIINQEDMICNNPSINFKVMKMEKQYHMFAVNSTQNQYYNIKFVNNMPKKSPLINLHFENNRQIKTNTNIFFDNFSSYQGHVYSWDAGPNFISTPNHIPKKDKCFFYELK